jgi:4-hydroxy-4-methyl-2-oxoglutarate aldolase
MVSDSIRPSRLPATEADLKLFGQIEENLYTAVISDALDELGYRGQALREFIRPLSTNDRFAGWARTLSCVDVYHIAFDPYAKEIEAMDSILPGEVIMVPPRDRRRTHRGANCYPQPLVRGERRER